MKRPYYASAADTEILPTAIGALRRIAELHSEIWDGTIEECCAECSDDGTPVLYPCPTLRIALNVIVIPEPRPDRQEWRY